MGIISFLRKIFRATSDGLTQAGMPPEMAGYGVTVAQDPGREVPSPEQELPWELREDPDDL